ncbi:MAG TPA: winged helix-turn-helix domain-containing protein [Candidatus Binatia bacterium]|jgi:hypothetical protein
MKQNEPATGGEIMLNAQNIGEIAGMVWDFLRTKGKSSLNAVERGIKAPKPLVDMAIGWLAREGKVELRQEKRSIQVWLTEG